MSKGKAWFVDSFKGLHHTLFTVLWNTTSILWFMQPAYCGARKFGDFDFFSGGCLSNKIHIPLEYLAYDRSKSSRCRYNLHNVNFKSRIPEQPKPAFCGAQWAWEPEIAQTCPYFRIKSSPYHGLGLIGKVIIRWLSYARFFQTKSILGGFGPNNQ